MKFIVAATVAILTVGCSATPTAPSSDLATATLAADQAAKPGDRTAGWQRVTLFFDGHGLDIGDHRHQVGNDHLVGLSVRLHGYNTQDSASGIDYYLTTGKQATVTADFPRSYNRLDVYWDASDGWCAGERHIDLPIRSGPGEEQPDWIVVSRGC